MGYDPSMSQWEQRPSQAIVIDGANVAYSEQNQAGKPQLANLRHMHEAVVSLGYRPLTIVDAQLWHEIDQPDDLDKLIESGEVEQSPAGTDADYFIQKRPMRSGPRLLLTTSMKTTEIHTIGLRIGGSPL